jgi:ribosome-associated heat shock protein Hsp15
MQAEMDIAGPLINYAAKGNIARLSGKEFINGKEAKKWIIEVSGLLYTRVQYAEAIKNYIDLTPEEDTDKMQTSAFVFQTGKRQSKQGRPTKKEKRNLDEFSNP